MLKRNVKKRASKPLLIIHLDTETFKSDDPVDPGTPLIIPYLVGWECEGNYYQSIGTNHTKFMEFVFSKCKKYKVEIWIFNAMYDLTVLLPNTITTFKKNYQIDYKVTDKKKFISFVYTCKHGINSYRFEVKDASVWYKLGSLDDWGKSLGLDVTKGSIDYDKWDVTVDHLEGVFRYKNSLGEHKTSSIKEEVEYINKDNYILKKVREYQNELRAYLSLDVLKLNKEVHTTTSASFGKACFNAWYYKKTGIKKYFDERFRPKLEDVDLYRQMLLSSRGGFTACNSVLTDFYDKEGKIASYDVNSMYPFWMVDGLPCGDLLNYKPKKGRYFKFYEVKMTYARWKPHLSFISQSPYPDNWFESMYLPFIISDYVERLKPYIETDMKIIGTYYMESSKEIGPFIEDLMGEKIRIDQNKDDPNWERNRGGVKLLMNSLYGKLCERTYEKDNYYDVWDLNFASEEAKSINYRSLMAGVYISQMSRLMILTAAISEIVDNKHTFFYSDTDSIKILEERPVRVKIHDSKLGYFKHEGCFTHYKSNGKTKKWFLYNENTKVLKMAFSGVSNATLNLIKKHGTFELFELLFDPNSNPLIIKGNKGKRYNRYYQPIITDVDICTNSDFGWITHTIRFNKVDKKFIITPLKEWIKV